MLPSAFILSVAMAAALVPASGGGRIQPAAVLDRTASDTMFPGDPALRTIVLHPQVDTIEVFGIANGSRRLISTSIQSVAATADGYIIAQWNVSPTGTSYDSIWVDRGTFLTRKHTDSNPGGWRRIAFEGTHVRGAYKDSTGEHPIDIERPRAMIDNSIAAVLTTKLPLVPDYVKVIPTYDIAGDERSITVRVAGAESVTHNGAPVDTWKIALDFNALGRQWVVNRWINRVSRREVQWTLTISGRDMIGIAK